MKRLIVVLGLSLWTIPLWAQTRLYFPVTEAADVTPAAFTTGWEDTTEAEIRKLMGVKGSDAITIGQVVDIVEDTTNDELDRQFVSARMAAGNVFTSGVTTVRAVVMMREYGATDDVNQCIMAIRIVTSDGATTQATLFTVANRGPVLEFVNNATHRNKQCADGDAIGASYTTVLGDRIVVEIGYNTDGANTTPQASAKWGQNATDCAENETNTADCAGWVEFSNAITFESVVLPLGPPRWIYRMD